MLDGLINYKTVNDTTNIFYTSNDIFYRYFEKDHIVSTDSLTPKQLEKIINAAFCSDWNFTNFISYKLPSNSNTHAYAIIGVGGQDYPFGPPDLLYVFVNTGGYTYIIQKNLRDHPLIAISDCEKIKDSAAEIEKKYSDIKLLDKQMEKVVERFCNCYVENLKYTDQYPRVQRMINEMYEDLQDKIK